MSAPAVEMPVLPAAEIREPDLNAPLRRRLMAFGILMAGLLAAIGWAATTAWREVAQLRRRFDAAQFESFRVAGQFQSSVLGLQGELLGYEIGGSEQDWARLQKESHELDQWIDAQRATLKSMEEKRAMAEIDAGYDRFLAVAATVHREHTERSAPAASRVRQIEQTAGQMVALGSRLADAHRRALGDLLGASRRSLQRLELWLGCGFLLTLAAGGWMTRSLYRGTVAPLRRQLIETQTLIARQEKLASLGVLAASVAHEIRNPLTAIKTRLFTLGKRVKGDPPAVEDASIIDHEIDRLERIVREFLAFARPGDPELTDLNPEELLQDVCTLLADEFLAHKVTLWVERPAEPLTIRADAQQLKQVLINLARNAAESIAGRGRVTLRARRERQSRRREAVILEVADTGAGIPPEIRARLFDPFFTTKPTGTGLGLSIAARILEKHGGTLQFQSVPGGGTTFGLVLPMVEGTAAKSAA